MPAAFKAAVRGNLEGWMKADAAALGRVHTNIVRTAGFRTQKGIKKQIKQNFEKSDGFLKTIRVQSNPPRGFSTKTTVRVYSKAKYKATAGRRAKGVDLLEIYSRPETVRAANKKWLAFPTKNAPLRSGRGGSRYAQPSESGLELVFLKGKTDDKAYLVTKVKYGQKPVLMYELRRFTHRRARVNPDAVHRETLGRMAGEMQKIFIREDQRMRRDFGVGMSRVENL